MSFSQSASIRLKFCVPMIPAASKSVSIENTVIRRSKASLTSPRELLPLYWQQLVEQGVPLKVARVIAEAIANYDSTSRAPTSQQQRLIYRYCRFVCRAKLWRARLLLMSTSSNC